MLDWRDKGYYVTSVKDQGQCKAGWAFASTAFYESHYLIRTKNPVFTKSNPLDFA